MIKMNEIKFLYDLYFGFSKYMLEKYKRKQVSSMLEIN